jgi:acyl-coenzyme A thioesterase PaaI-like protein
MSRGRKKSSPRLEPGPNHFCFVCGTANPRGLRLVFTFDERARRVRGRFCLDRFCQGPRGFVHGGIIAAVLDEAMGKLSRLAGVTPSTGLRVNSAGARRRNLRFLQSGSPAAAGLGASLGRFGGAAAVTARLDVRYLRPIRVGEEIRVEAREVGRDGRTFRRRAEIRNAAGKLAAEGRGRFVAVDSRPRKGSGKGISRHSR